MHVAGAPAQHACMQQAAMHVRVQYARGRDGEWSSEAGASCPVSFAFTSNGIATSDLHSANLLGPQYGAGFHMHGPITTALLSE